MKSDSTVRKHLKALRRDCIEQEHDVVLSRVAYAIECAILWSREDTVRWDTPSQLAALTAYYIDRKV